ncbi:DNA recombination protein RmuC [Candidatus Falkowbacteria bacterium CG10_big_fil_rev_8_21_14_0_10_44_15]|uniref:DNA recombination protein RmuC n=1 Tax=Candidatus Falkowbacteria bacterium CG10_big_fil_rev_8_21_14_0_10_44_15 TaxID=1974569 RepID=A0A2H0V234_9BACT|nr:MAG: DNA recombination protein RmuC [Candidatus Falkowbacteria bacterium CG10_big_fil_rev_8_21_14_0_10_44_15]
METLLIILVIILTAMIGAMFFVVQKKLGGKQDGQSLLILQQQMGQMTQTLDAKLAEVHKASQDQFGRTTGIMQGVTEQAQKMLSAIHSQSQNAIAAVTEKLTKLDETNKQVVNFAEQLQSLEDILKNPKHRGILGEYQLEMVLKNVLPPAAYKLQYEFADGEIVDAAVFVKDKIIPVDSKFSLENYNRIVREKDPAARAQLEKEFKLDLKKRIDETAKYIKPSQGTMDFAFMFIPAEGIYYDLLINQVGGIKVNTRDLIEYAFSQKHVIIVSPTSFHAYLQTVLQGLRALQIEESAKEIRQRVEQLGKHLASYDEYMKKLGANLGTTVNMYNSAYKEFGKVDKDVLKISGGKSQLEPLTLDRPKTEE